MGRRRRIRIPITLKEEKWEPGVADGVFSRTRKFPAPTLEDMIRAIYYRVVVDTTTIKHSSGKTKEFIWDLTDVDKKPDTKKKDKIESKKDDAIWIA